MKRYHLEFLLTNPPRPLGIVETEDGRFVRAVALLNRVADATMEEGRIMVAALNNSLTDRAP